MRRGWTNVVGRESRFSMNYKDQAKKLQREAQVYYFVFKHPGVRWYAKLVAICSAGYVFSPIQLIPSYIPVIGVLDDFLVLFVGAKVLQRIIPAEVFADCRQQAEAAEMRRKDEIRSTAAAGAFMVIAAVWLLAAVGASILMAKHIFPDKVIAR